MKKTTFHVLFRKDTDGTILAVFPYLKGTQYFNSVLCFTSLCQHRTIDYDYVITSTKPALHQEYNLLKFYMETHLGYDLKLLKRTNYKEFINAQLTTNNQIKL